MKAYKINGFNQGWVKHFENQRGTDAKVKTRP